ncbi:MAG: polymer-forming cytoskeletal protein [Bacteroidales bacterium]|nr:polymer-forming cytoskeletal protein [Bacteroidales bacterium]
MARMEETSHFGVNEIARIPVGAEVRGGVMISAGDIRIDGNFFGKILSKGKIVLGDGAVVEGDILCHNADISGRFSGKMIVEDLLTLTRTCDFKGMLSTAHICIEEGADYNGICKMISEEEFTELSAEFEKALYDSGAQEEDTL